jgi:hypothetical protein
MMVDLKRVGRRIAFGIAFVLAGHNQVCGQQAQVSPEKRYVWIEVPYAIANPGMIFGGGTSCYGGSASSSYGTGSAYIQPYGNGVSVNGSGIGFGSTSGYSQCTNSPSLSIPSTTTNKMLSVHIDCQERTYDAKGDGKGWTAWGEERAVYERAVAACQPSNVAPTNQDMARKWEQAKASLAARKEQEIKAIRENKYNLDWCISGSLENMKDQAPFWELQPAMVGLTSRDQVIRFMTHLQASLENDCRGELELIKSGASQHRIDLHWAKVASKAIEKSR